MVGQKIPAPERSEQAPQTPDSKHGPKYDNDVSGATWLRGGGPGQATGKPGFDHTDKGRR